MLKNCIFLLFGAAIILSSCASTSTLARERHGENTGLSRIRKRGAEFIGEFAIQAFKKLLVDAKLLPFLNRCCRDYQKTGTLRDALREFKMFHPRDVKTEKLSGGIYVRTGEVEDRQLVFRSSGIYGKPTIEIVDRRKLEKGPLEWSLTDEPPIQRISYYREGTD